MTFFSLSIGVQSAPEVGPTSYETPCIYIVSNCYESNLDFKFYQYNRNSFVMLTKFLSILHNTHTHTHTHTVYIKVRILSCTICVSRTGVWIQIFDQVRTLS